MNNEKSPEQQKPQPGGAVSAPDTKTNTSLENQGQGNRPQGISKKNPSQGGEPKHQDQAKPEDEKRRAS